MIKNVWVQPQTVVQQFVANEYVANSCEEAGAEYVFHCNAPGGRLYYYPKSDGQIDGNYTGSGRKQFIGSFSPCPVEHRTPTTDAFYDGFIDYNRNGKHDSGEGVIVWRGENGRNGHATKDLDMNTWEKTFS